MWLVRWVANLFCYFCLVQRWWRVSIVIWWLQSCVQQDCPESGSLDLWCSSCLAKNSTFNVCRCFAHSCSQMQLSQFNEFDIFFFKTLSFPGPRGAGKWLSFSIGWTGSTWKVHQFHGQLQWSTQGKEAQNQARKTVEQNVEVKGIWELRARQYKCLLVLFSLRRSCWWTMPAGFWDLTDPDSNQTRRNLQRKN